MIPRLDFLPVRRIAWLAAALVAAPMIGKSAGVETPASPLAWSVRSADTLLARGSDDFVYRAGGKAKWTYQSGFVLHALLRLHDATNDARYLEFVRTSIDSFVGTDGTIATYDLGSYNLDNINTGKAVLDLYRRAGAKAYELAALRLREQLRGQPRTSEGGFWHKRRYPSQMWLDGVYMASPFLAGCGAQFHDAAAFEDVARQVRLIDAHLYDAATGLYFHGWDESRKQIWANKQTGLSACFWSRAIGWYGMALIDALDFIPAQHPARADIERSFRQLCAGVLRHQDPASGVWFQVTDQGKRAGNYLEETGSAMFVYLLAKGVNRGLLDRTTTSAIERAYAGLLREFIRCDAQGRVEVTRCCRGAGLSEDRPGTFEYYISEPVVTNDPKGIAPFILAGIEVERLALPAAHQR
jgi:unsaturated rhamnogalacturonyl hydrolase